MKLPLPRSLVLALAFSPVALFAQGSLLPAGAPAPTMKTLAQIEARTPVDTLAGDATASYIISLPGSYYLTGNLSGSSTKDGIRIDAENVTLDLNGFTVEGVAGSQYGIRVIAAGGLVTIRNGWVRFWEKDGVYNAGGTKLVVEDMNVASVQLAGIRSDGPLQASRCKIRNAQSGISSGAQFAEIEHCAIQNITGPGTGDVAGIFGYSGAVRFSEVTSVTGGATITGISFPYVQDSVVRGVQSATADVMAYGIRATVVERSRAESLSAASGNGWGIYANSATECVVSYVTAKSCVGLRAEIAADRCTAQNIGSSTTSVGILSPSVNDCRVRSVTATTHNSTGIGVGVGGCASRNYVETVDGNGIALLNQGSAYDNYVRNAGANGGTGTGIDGNTYPGVHLERNRAVSCDIGIRAIGTGAVAIRNTAVDNTTNFSLNATMTVVTPAALGTNPNANISQ